MELSSYPSESLHPFPTESRVTAVLCCLHSWTFPVEDVVTARARLSEGEHETGLPLLGQPQSIGHTASVLCSHLLTRSFCRCCSAAKLRLPPWDPVDCSVPGSPDGGLQFHSQSSLGKLYDEWQGPQSVDPWETLRSQPPDNLWRPCHLQSVCESEIKFFSF